MVLLSDRDAEPQRFRCPEPIASPARNRPDLNRIDALIAQRRHSAVPARARDDRKSLIRLEVGSWPAYGATSDVEERERLARVYFSVRI
jgi:hypothetical protein